MMIKFKKNRILLVDDEEFCISSLLKMISKTGLDSENRVDAGINGKEALDHVMQS
jgi:YesN/AraC family two-component response regulator